jgi:hypothetical protein
MEIVVTPISLERLSDDEHHASDFGGRDDLVDSVAVNETGERTEVA